MMFNIGDTVNLTPEMMAVQVHPEHYAVPGKVTGTGAWGTVDVDWPNIGHTITVREDEISRV